MNHRIARKIVQAFERDPTSATGYTNQQIHAAHIMLGRKPNPNKLGQWQNAKAAEGMRPTETPKKVAAKVGVMEVEVEAGEDGVLGTDDDKVTIKPTDEPEEENLADLKVAELKARAKKKGVKGYSKMKKADLIAALSSQ